MESLQDPTTEMLAVNFKLASVLIALTLGSFASNSKADYSKGFYNRSGCLYAYMKGGSFELTKADGEVISEKFDLDLLKYDEGKSKCLAEKTNIGKLVFSYELEKNKHLIDLITVGMRISSSPTEGTWEISQANLTIATPKGKRVYPLKHSDIYASNSHSYSCSQLTLYTMNKRKIDNETERVKPKARITLHKFQVQPFKELDSTIFASSYDCSIWISIPGLMGLVLIVFMTFVTIGGVYFLSKIETNDFKHNKEGQMFTQYQMESIKR